MKHLMLSGAVAGLFSVGHLPTLAVTVADGSYRAGTRAPAHMSRSIAAVTAREFSAFLSDSTSWEERTKAWQTRPGSPGGDSRRPVFSRISATAETNSIRLSHDSLTDGLPRVIAKYVNEGRVSADGLAPGDSLFLVVQWDPSQRNVRAYRVRFTAHNALQVSPIGSFRVCHHYRSSDDDLSAAGWTDPRGCDQAHAGVSADTTAQPKPPGPHPTATLWIRCLDGCCEVEASENGLADADALIDD